MERVRRSVGRMLDGDSGEFVDVGNQPRFGAVGDVAVGEQDDRRHVSRGDGEGFDGRLEAIGRGARGDDGHGAFAVAAEHGLEQIGLLGFGRQAGAGSAALDVDDDQRQFGHDGQTDGFGLEGDAGAAGAGCAQRAAEAGADGGTDGGDFVLGLECADAEMFLGGKIVQDVAGGRDRIAAVNQRLASEP